LTPESSKGEAADDSRKSAKKTSELELTREALREVEEKCQAIINNIEDGYYEVDLEGNFTYFNDAMTRITGYALHELMGMNARKILDEFNFKQVYEKFEKVYYTRMATRAIDWELIRKDGTKRFIEVSVSLKKDLNLRPVGFWESPGTLPIAS
jgi:PAS domain S-box-containing protein